MPVFRERSELVNDYAPFSKLGPAVIDPLKSPAMRYKRHLLPVLAAALALLVFVIDAFTPLDIAIAVLYVIVVLLVSSSGTRAATLAAMWVCVVLTLVGFVVSHDDNVSGSAIGRCAVSLLAIGTAAILSLRSQAAMAKMEEQVQLLNLTHDAIVAHDMNDHITFWNRGAEALYGYPAQAAIGNPIDRMTTPPNSHFPRAQILSELLRSGRWEGEITRSDSDGREIVIASRAALLRDAHGMPRVLLTTSNDVTQQKRMEAELQRQRDALKRSEALLLDAQRLSLTASIATSLPAGTMWWSDEAYRIFDYPRDMTPSIGAILARAHPDDVEIVRAAHNAALASVRDIDVEHRLLLPDGRIKHVRFVARRSSSDNDGDEYVGALMDVTETKLAQETLARLTAELAHVTRVTMLGELAASIAHEVTQPIAAIVTNGDAGLRWLNRAQPDIAEAQQSITQIIRDARRATEVIARIRAMARNRDSKPATLDINEIVGETIDLVRREFARHRVEVGTDLATPSPTVRCDRVQLQQVLINLIMNAVQAMSGVNGPRVLRIATLESETDRGHAKIVVQDSGTGISDENARRLFNAFFTTKADGMGMGLSICRSIIEAHGGRIWAESPDEGGARLCFQLPANEGGDDEH